MRVRNLMLLFVFLSALLLLPSVRAYTTNTDQEWYYGYFPDGGTTNGSEIIDCDKSYLINNNILDINTDFVIGKVIWVPSYRRVFFYITTKPNNSNFIS